ncbi:MAG: hypothetical protein FIB08_12975 [Candidatus Methanoperedens sp.]|nr:hypothetical protein [Candidatus Methanoperedens sp.]
MKRDSSLSVFLKNCIVSHRIRGFGKSDSSIFAIERALKSEIKFIEVDTRHTLDNEIVIFHDPFLGEITTGSGFIKDKTLKELKREKLIGDNIPIATLDEVLTLFSQSESNATLCIDIKDPGLIKKYCEYVKYHGLEENVIFISWIPENLTEIYEILPKIPLFFSYIPIKRWYNPFLTILNFIKNFLVIFKSMVALTGSFRLLRLETLLLFIDSYCEPIKHYSEKGWNYVHLISGLPSKNLSKILIESGGGICVPYQIINKKFIEEAHSEGLKVWVFTINNIGILIEYILKIKPDVIFSDNAKEIIELTIENGF